MRRLEIGFITYSLESYPIDTMYPRLKFKRARYLYKTSGTPEHHRENSSRIPVIFELLHNYRLSISDCE